MHEMEKLLTDGQMAFWATTLGCQEKHKILITFTKIVMQHFSGYHLKNQPSEDRNRWCEKRMDYFKIDLKGSEYQDMN